MALCFTHCTWDVRCVSINVLILTHLSTACPTLRHDGSVCALPHTPHTACCLPSCLFVCWTVCSLNRVVVREAKRKARRTRQQQQQLVETPAVRAAAAWQQRMVLQQQQQVERQRRGARAGRRMQVGFSLWVELQSAFSLKVLESMTHLNKLLSGVLRWRWCRCCWLVFCASVLAAAEATNCRDVCLTMLCLAMLCCVVLCCPWLCAVLCFAHAS